MNVFDRRQRVGARLRRELAELFQHEVRDPRIGGITIQEVRVSRDLAYAKVFFTCFPREEDAREQVRLLNGPLAGFLRGQLARRVRLRTVPQLRFIQDTSILQGEHLSRLIQENCPPPREETEETDDSPPHRR